MLSVPAPRGVVVFDDFLAQRVGKTDFEIIREEASKRGQPEPDDELCDRIRWSHTGFPSFWPVREGENIEDCFRRQVCEYFE